MAIFDPHDQDPAPEAKIAVAMLPVSRPSNDASLVTANGPHSNGPASYEKLNVVSPSATQTEPRK